jgi:WD40 repeat protein
VYYYDLRNPKIPLCTMIGHSKTVSYVKFVDSSTLVSSSTDNTLKLWDLSMSASGINESPLHSFTGHTNLKVTFYPEICFQDSLRSPVSEM